ncbi:MAG: thiamine-phosphate kinase, partial [Gemmatimonadales bacterium]
IWRRLGERGDAVGDDCAVVEMGGKRVAIATDLAVEGRHFRIGWISHYEAGWRAAAAALSDLAAVAAEPRGVLVSLGVPAEWPDVFVEDVMDGVGAVTEWVGGRVWGGDLIQANPAVIDVTVVGEARSPVMRSGGASGDGVWVTGTLGGPRAALGAWASGLEPEESARERFARPIPRIREASWLMEQGATAMIDVSDGLVGDAGHIAAASGVAVVLESELVPVHPAAEPKDALVGGEEFELLVTLPRSSAQDIGARFEEEFGVRFTRVGAVEAGFGVRVLRGGSPVEVPAGYSHF